MSARISIGVAQHGEVVLTVLGVFIADIAVFVVLVDPGLGS
jgi:hypothetical protein